MNAPPAGRWALAVAVSACLLLAAIGLGQAPFLHYAWGFTLWHYLPPAAGYLLAGLLALLCLPAVRGRLIAAAARAWDALGSSRAAALPPSALPAKRRHGV